MGILPTAFIDRRRDAEDRESAFAAIESFILLCVLRVSAVIPFIYQVRRQDAHTTNQSSICAFTACGGMLQAKSKALMLSSKLNVLVISGLTSSLPLDIRAIARG